MEHLSDKQLLELLERSGDRKDALPGHLDRCMPCQKRWQSLQESWHSLGAWTVDMPAIDLTERILCQVVPQRTIFLWQPQAWVRIAASVMIGVGLGLLMGRIGSTPASREQMTQAFYLDTLSLNSSTGWTAPLLDGPQEP
jgi:hypothetical protein